MGGPQGWEPATDVEVALYDALATGDQEKYFRTLAGVNLLLPVSADAAAGRTPIGWGTWTANNHTHLLAFTSDESMRTCLAQHAGGARRMSLSDLAAIWPNNDWWLAVNPGLPIEGYLPAWFVVQLARGDARLPGLRSSGMPRDRLERVQALERAKAAKAAAGPQEREPIRTVATAGGPLALPGALREARRRPEPSSLDAVTIEAEPAEPVAAPQPAPTPVSLFQKVQRPPQEPQGREAPEAATVSPGATLGARFAASVSPAPAPYVPPAAPPPVAPPPPAAAAPYSPPAAAPPPPAQQDSPARLVPPVRRRHLDQSASASKSSPWETTQPLAQPSGPAQPIPPTSAPVPAAPPPSPHSHSWETTQPIESQPESAPAAPATAAPSLSPSSSSSWETRTQRMAPPPSSGSGGDWETRTQRMAPPPSSGGGGDWETKTQRVSPPSGDGDWETRTQRMTQPPSSGGGGDWETKTQWVSPPSGDGEWETKTQPIGAAPRQSLWEKPQPASAPSSPSALEVTQPISGPPAAEAPPARPEPAAGEEAKVDRGMFGVPATAPDVPGKPRHAEPEPDFVPANAVEEQLFEAAEAGNTDAFLSTLLLATVLIPKASGTTNGKWRPQPIDGEPHIVSYTSTQHLTEQLETIPIKFVKLISEWPDPNWSFAVNPGTPVGATLPGGQLLALASWAAEVGLGREDEEQEEPSVKLNGISVAGRVNPEVTVLQKAIAPSKVGYYLDRGYDRVTGFVHRAHEVGQIRTARQMVEALGLGWEGSPFSGATEEIYLLRWSAYRPSLYRIPYGGQNEQAMRAMEGWVIERAPFRGNGFAPGESKEVIAEFKVDSVRLPHGARLLRLREGAEELIAVFDADGPRWLRTDGGAE